MNKKSAEAVRFRSTLEKSDNKLWGCHFRVPTPIAKKFVNRGNRRVVCTLNGSAEKQCALIPFGKGSLVITVNKSLQKQLGLAVGKSVEVLLRKDTSAYGLPEAQEWREVLRQDKEGNRLFHALTPGRKRTLLYIVAQAKNIDDRIFRSLTIVRHLKANQGKIDYRQLYLALRKSSS